MAVAKPRIAAMGLALASVLGSLALAEVGLYLADFPPAHRSVSKEAHLERAEPDSLRERVGWTNARSAVKTFRYDGDPRGYFGANASVAHTTNRLGFRGQEFSRTKPPGTIRIAALGDSFTMGEGVHDDDTWPAQLERALQAALPSLRIEVQNWGVGGYNTEQEATLFEALVLDYAPDIVVLGFTPNDAEPRLLRFDSETGRALRVAPGTELLVPQRIAEPRGWDRLRVVRLVRSGSINRALTRAVIEHHEELYSGTSSGWQDAREALLRTAKACRERGLGRFAVAFPLLWKLSDYPLAEVQREVVATLREAGFDTVDLLPELRDHEGPDLWVHPTDQHPNEVVHELVADLLAARILASPDATVLLE